jgi:rSAM/selenodomain-associated transferase 1
LIICDIFPSKIETIFSLSYSGNEPTVNPLFMENIRHQNGSPHVDDRCLLLLVKDPACGPVKTRLARAIGEEITRALYENFIHDMISRFEREGFPLFICVHPENALAGLKTLFGEHLHYLPQRGADLGQRMEGCLRYAFSRDFHRAILIGSDIPDLPGEIITDAFRFLNTVDCVIGPSLDGGYYLIGFREDSLLPEAFSGIPWGIDTVLGETIEVLTRYHRTIHLLRTWGDIDTFDDLKRFIEQSKDTSRCPRTMAYIRSVELPLLINTGNH